MQIIISILPWQKVLLLGLWKKSTKNHSETSQGQKAKIHKHLQF